MPEAVTAPPSTDLSALRPIAGQLPIGQRHGRRATNGRTPRQAGVIVTAAQRGQGGRDPVATLDVECKGVDAGLGVEFAGQHVGPGGPRPPAA